MNTWAGGWDLSFSPRSIAWCHPVQAHQLPPQPPNSASHPNSKENGQSNDEPVVHVGVPGPAAGEEERGIQGIQLDSEAPVASARQRDKCTRPSKGLHPATDPRGALQVHPISHPQVLNTRSHTVTHAPPLSSWASANSHMLTQHYTQNNRWFTPMLIKAIRKAPWTAKVSMSDHHTRPGRFKKRRSETELIC